MIESKAWDWEKLHKEEQKIWLEPSIESYYLLNRWQKQNKKEFLDLGCGIGRHTVLFAQNGFNTSGFDLSEEAVNSTKEYANKIGLKVKLQKGDMLSLPYKDNEFDCILCYNVISHSDTEGILKIIKEINRVLKNDGECYLTLCSKDTWGFKQETWPLVDSNTRIRMDEGPEHGVPHFYADYDLICELFKEFIVKKITHVQDFYWKNGKTCNSYHYHILIRKN